MLESITKRFGDVILRASPELDVRPLHRANQWQLKLKPEELLAAIEAQMLAEWALKMSARCCLPTLVARKGGRPASYRDSSILLMAIVQITWRKSYEQIVDQVVSTPSLAQALGFSGRTISQGQYWERRQQLGHLPFVFFFMALAAQLIRLGTITGKGLLVDATLLRAWRHADPGARWQKYAGRKAVFGYKVHVVLCRDACLPLFVLVTPAHVHDSQVGWLIVLLTGLFYAIRVGIVYADAAYFDSRMFKVVHDILGAHPAINYNLRKAGKTKLATLFFLKQCWRLVILPRTGIERHFAWTKRYFGLKDFQCFTLPRVTQFVLLTYIAILAVALAAVRYQRPDLATRRARVIAR
jgi:hypothetical protein